MVCLSSAALRFAKSLDRTRTRRVRARSGRVGAVVRQAADQATVAQPADRPRAAESALGGCPAGLDAAIGDGTPTPGPVAARRPTAGGRTATRPLPSCAD